MTQQTEHDDIFGSDDSAEFSGTKILSFKDELAAMPVLIRWIVYTALGFMVLLSIQCLFIMPTIIIRYGWGIGGGFVQ